MNKPHYQSKPCLLANTWQIVYDFHLYSVCASGKCCITWKCLNWSCLSPQSLKMVVTFMSGCFQKLNFLIVQIAVLWVLTLYRWILVFWRNVFGSELGLVRMQLCYVGRLQGRWLHKLVGKGHKSFLGWKERWKNTAMIESVWNLSSTHNNRKEGGRSTRKIILPVHHSLGWDWICFLFMCCGFEWALSLQPGSYLLKSHWFWSGKEMFISTHSTTQCKTRNLHSALWSIFGRL
jgi:hypothetical protein